MTTALFGFRAIAEAVDLDPREVIATVRAGHSDRHVGVAFHRQADRNRSRDVWERFLRSIEEVTANHHRRSSNQPLLRKGLGQV